MGKFRGFYNRFWFHYVLIYIQLFHRFTEKNLREMDIRDGAPVSHGYCTPAEWETHSQTWFRSGQFLYIKFFSSYKKFVWC